MRHANRDSDRDSDPQSMLDSWYRNYSGELRAFICKRLRDPELADDLLHDTFVVAATKSNQYTESGQSRAFLNSIAKKLMLSATRLKRRRNTTHQRITDEASIRDSSVKPDPQENEQQQNKMQISDAIEQLPSNDRKIIELRFHEKLKFGSIARILQIPTNTAISRLHRAISKIRRQLHRT